MKPRNYSGAARGGVLISTAAIVLTAIVIFVVPRLVRSRDKPTPRGRVALPIEPANEVLFISDFKLLQFVSGFDIRISDFPGSWEATMP